MSLRILIISFIAALVCLSCSGKDPKPVDDSTRREADAFLKSHSEQFQKIYYEANKAQWLANTQ